MILALALYGSLAALALWATWRDFYLRPLGLVLAAGFLLSNSLYFASITAVERAGPYSGIEVLVAAAAFYALAVRSRWLILVLAFNLLSIASNIGIAVNNSPDQQQIFAWIVTTNICFAAECVVTTGVGIAHGYRTGRFHRRIPVRRWANSLGLARAPTP